MRSLLRPYKALRKYSTVAKGKRDGWQSVVGLEVHAQIQSSTKLFSPSGSNFGSPVNTLVSLFDASVPGTLPVLNRQCVELAVSTAMALSCNINMNSMFDRKHYFYADLPAGYQITQQRKAIAEDGKLEFLVITPSGAPKPYFKTCAIRQLQLEQDSGKSLHDADSDKSLIDLNRAGIALMEIVFQPDLATGEEAAALVKELSLILQTLDACNCQMEEGSLRVDANISVNRPGEGLGTRTEVKNLSSLRSLVSAIEFEISRQIDVLESGKLVTNETRSFDANSKITLPMRDKEVQQDYRFMPEPNLPPLRLYDNPADINNSLANQINIASIKQRKVVLPDTIRQNLVSEFGLRIEHAHTMLTFPNMVSYFKNVMKDLPANYGVRACNILLSQVMEELYKRDLTFETIEIKPESISQIVELVESGKLHVSSSNDVLDRLFNGDTRTVIEIVEGEGWILIKDDQLIRSICEKVINDNEKVAAKCRTNKKHINKLMGMVKKSSSQKIDMKTATKIMEELLQ